MIEFSGLKYPEPIIAVKRIIEVRNRIRFSLRMKPVSKKIKEIPETAKSQSCFRIVEEILFINIDIGCNRFEFIVRRFHGVTLYASKFNSPLTAGELGEKLTAPKSVVKIRGNDRIAKIKINIDACRIKFNALLAIFVNGLLISNKARNRMYRGTPR